MKKHLSILLVLLVVMSVFASTVVAAPAGGKSMELVSTTYEKYGIVLIFKTSGLTQADLKDASIFADSTQKGMTCDLLDDGTTVRCSVDKNLAGLGGFKVEVAGFIFWGELPQKRNVCLTNEIVWYSFDFYYYGELQFSFETPAWAWEQALAEGWIAEAAAEGITYGITGEFCGPDVPLIPV